MSRNKTDPTPTMFLSTSQIRQEHKRRIRDAAEALKKNAIEEANKPMGLCLVITVFMIILVIAPPMAIVLL